MKSFLKIFFSVFLFILISVGVFIYSMDRTPQKKVAYECATDLITEIKSMAKYADSMKINEVRYKYIESNDVRIDYDLYIYLDCGLANGFGALKNYSGTSKYDVKGKSWKKSFQLESGLSTSNFYGILDSTLRSDVNSIADLGRIDSWKSLHIDKVRKNVNLS